MSRKIIFTAFALCIAALILVVMSNNQKKTEAEQLSKLLVPINDDIKEPSQFPFKADDVSATIDIEPTAAMHQFIFQYRNKKSTQQINYIVNKVYDRPKINQIPSAESKIKYKLKNGDIAYYEEDSTSQSIWWKNKNGFVACYMYSIKDHTAALGKYKLKANELVELVNQVQE